MERPRWPDTSLREYTVHVGEGSRLSSTLLEEEDVHKLSPEESQGARPCRVLATSEVMSV